MDTQERIQEQITEQLFPTDKKPQPLKNAVTISMDRIKPRLHQPRTRFDLKELADLTKTIEELGVLQPIMVRYEPGNPNHDTYEIVFGERRFRAVHQAGLTEIPCIIKDTSDNRSLEIALIENIQSVELTPLEEGRALKEIQRRRKCSDRALVPIVGKSWGWVRNRPELADSVEETPDLEPLANTPSGMSAALELGRLKKQPRARNRLRTDYEEGRISVAQVKSEVKTLTGQAKTPPAPPQREIQPSAETLAIVTPYERNVKVKELLFEAKLKLDSVLEQLAQGILDPDNLTPVYEELDAVQARVREINEMVPSREYLRMVG